MKYFVLLLILFVLYLSYVNNWKTVLYIDIGALITYIIIIYKSRGKSDEEKDKILNFWGDGYIYILYAFFIGSCMFSGDSDKKEEVTPQTQQVEQMQSKQENDERSELQKKYDDQKRYEEWLAWQEQQKQQSVDSKKWCENMLSMIDDINSDWQNLINNIKYVEPMQKLAKTMENAHNNIKNSQQYKIPENAPNNIKHKMKNAVDVLLDSMEDLAYVLRVEAEAAEEVTGSYDLPKHIVIPVGASNEEIVYYMEIAKSRNQDAKDKIKKAKKLILEIQQEANIEGNDSQSNGRVGDDGRVYFNIR